MSVQTAKPQIDWPFISGITTHLVHLSLSSSPFSGCVSPETMTNFLIALICLESLCLVLPVPPYDVYEEGRHSPSLSRAVLPFLASFEFRGAGKYLDNLVTLIDAPQLDKFNINLFDITDPDTPELLQFIRRTPRLTSPDEARMNLRDDTSVQVSFSSQTSRPSAFIIELERGWSNLTLSSLTHFCASSSAILRLSFPPWKISTFTRMTNFKSARRMT